MSLSLDTIMTVASLVKSAVAIYNKVAEWPEHMRKLGRRMRSLDVLLGELEDAVARKPDNAFIRLFANQKKHLALLLRDIRLDAEKVRALFARWEAGVGPLGLQFRHKVVTQAFFALGSPADEIAGLVEDVDEHLQRVRDYLQWMGFRGVILLGEGKGIAPAAAAAPGLRAVGRPQGTPVAVPGLKVVGRPQGTPVAVPGLKAVGRPQGTPVAVPGLKVVGRPQGMPAAVPGLQMVNRPQGTPVAVPGLRVVGRPQGTPAAPDKTGPGGRRPSPSPSPSPPRRDFRIIFIDPSNLGRSVVGEAVTKLIRGWTEASKGDWRITTVHSAGFRVRKRSDCVDVLESVFRPVVVDGGGTPNQTALSAVFDNRNFEYPFKQPLQETLARKTSIGIRKDLFRSYDMILVFTSQDLDKVLQLKTALVDRLGRDGATARGKGRVLHLGSYLTLDGIPREIVDPKPAGKAKAGRDDWNFKVSQVKLAVKEFLKQEMGWKPPATKKAEVGAAPPNEGKKAGEKNKAGQGGKDSKTAQKDVKVEKQDSKTEKKDATKQVQGKG